MTETICPTCGAKCKQIGKRLRNIQSIPTLDLTKLREAFKELLRALTDINEINFIRCSPGVEFKLDSVIRAAKELLEQEAK